jgi:tetratricopeptide (TPR) repeat protein
MKTKKSRIKEVIIIFGAVLLFQLNSGICATPEETKMYLEATEALREGNYQHAKVLLERLLETCTDSDLLIKADEKLTDALEGIQKSSYPEIPGIYVQKHDLSLAKLEKESIMRCTRAFRKTNGSLLDIQEQEAIGGGGIRFILNVDAPEFAADQISKFIIYNPQINTVSKCRCELIEECTTPEGGSWVWIDLPENAKGKTKYILYEKWSIDCKDGSKFHGDEFVKKTISEGMYEIIFPQRIGKSTLSRFLAITDGGGYAYPLVLHTSSFGMLYDRYLSKGQFTEEAVREMETAIEQDPDEPLLAWILAITYLKRKEYDLAIQLATKAVELGTATNHEYLGEFQKVLDNAKIMKNQQ